jgi:STE24 endopeptidase
MTGSRLPALVTLLALGAVLLVVLTIWTPWHTLPQPPGGAVAVDPSRDFTAAEMAREAAFHRAVRPAGYASLLISLVVALALGFTPAGARLIEIVARPLGGGWGWQVLLGGLGVALVGRVVTLPLSAWSETVLRKYGLSTRNWAGWAADVARSFAVSTVLLLLVLLGLVALARAFPRTWWAPASIAGALLVLLVTFAYPLLVEPVFNRFTPLPDGPQRASLLALARADGLEVDDVLVADASRRTSALNAYVSGFGSTRRIVVYDTALERLPESELRLIVAHELGHAKERDVLRGATAGALGVAATVCLLFLLMSWAPLLRRAGVVAAGDPRSLALLLAVIALLGTQAGPLQLLVSRRVEARADVHALELTRDPAGYAAMQRRLAVANISDLDPNPVVYGLFASHPTSPERIALARSWARLRGAATPPDLAGAADATHD